VPGLIRGMKRRMNGMMDNDFLDMINTSFFLDRIYRITFLGTDFTDYTVFLDRIKWILYYCLLNPGTRIQKTHNPPGGGGHIIL